jgi:hypothetical protein
MSYPDSSWRSNCDVMIRPDYGCTSDEVLSVSDSLLAALDVRLSRSSQVTDVTLSLSFSTGLEYNYVYYMDYLMDICTLNPRRLSSYPHQSVAPI